MKYCVFGKGKGASKMADQVVTKMLQEYSRQLFGFTRAEFDSIVEYDVINIMAYYYSKMNAQQKAVIVNVLQEQFELSYMDDTLEKLAMFADDEVYVPLSCKLMDRLGDSRVTIIVYETIFMCCANMTKNYWNQSNSYSNYLVLLNTAFFHALSYKLHIKDSYVNSMKALYDQDGYDEFVESLYEKHLDDMDWDADVELDVLDELIDVSKTNTFFDEGTQKEYMDAVEAMGNIRREHVNTVREEDETKGFARIVEKTGICELQSVDIHGFECHFCEAKYSDEKYIIIYQKDTHIRDIIDNEEEWSNFQRELYREDIRQDNSKAMVYIVYILDDNSDNIPIQVIESNKTYGRKYVFSEDETITFINGIVKTSSDEISAASPVQEWDRILREEHLTACLTEPYSAKKVASYLGGQRFDADYVHDDDYSTMKHSKVPQIKWVKSLETTGFRDFCFDQKMMTFGQINLFYGANGSGKTSVLEAIEYALTAEVRRVKDFKVKLPTDSFPKLHIYDTEAGVHTFTPGFSKKNNKEIERVWYGVPIGRTKSNLNENFNRFNAFDSEAAYKFIHESDNSEDSFASMFGNLMFGETVVDHEKKWQRFKRAFNDRYTELRSELSEARNMADIYERSLAQKTDSSKSEEIEAGIIALKLIGRARLPKGSSDRYPKILEEMKAIRKYVDVLSVHNMERMRFKAIAAQVTEAKKNNLLYTRRRKDKSEEITRLAEENGTIKKKIFDEREKQTGIQQRLDCVNTDIRNWTIIQNVLSHEETITANGIMINLFKECFKNTRFDYKEYQFVKRVNRPSEIKESSINDTKSIEELTLDDLTLDFHQFAQIRNILRKNQEKLVAREEWEELPEEVETAAAAGVQVQQPIIQTAPENFYMTLDSDERRVLDVLVADQPESVTEFVKLVSPFPNYKTILERINEKALDFYEEIIINTDEMLPYVEEDYLDELKEQHDVYYDKNKADLMIEEQRRLAEERSARLVDELKKSEAERRKLEAEREKEAELRRTEAERRTQLEEELCKAEEKSRQQEEQRKADDARRQEELRKAEEARQLEEQRRAEEEKVLQEVEQQKIRYKQMNVCQYCGGVFTGLFNKKCKVCGKPKDYA